MNKTIMPLLHMPKLPVSMHLLIREQVKRNSKRFPPDFMFQLTEEEVEFMVSQNVIPSRRHLGGGNAEEGGL